MASNDAENIAEDNTHATNEITLITMNLQDLSIAINEGTNGAIENNRVLEALEAIAVMESLENVATQEDTNGAQEDTNGTQKGIVEGINEETKDSIPRIAYDKKGKSKLNPDAEEFVYSPKSTHWEVSESSSSATHQEVNKSSLDPLHELEYTNPTILHGYVDPTNPYGYLDPTNPYGYLDPTNPYGYQHPYFQPHLLYLQPSFQSPNLHLEGYDQCHAQEDPSFLGREHGSRAILISGTDDSMSDAEIKLEMEKWGDVRSMKRTPSMPQDVIINYYDIRHAKEALIDIQAQHFNREQLPPHEDENKINEEQNKTSEPNLPVEPNGTPSILPHNDNKKGLIGEGVGVWAIYTQPPLDGSDNQGTLVVFNLDAHTDMACLNAMFQGYGGVRKGGAIKEWRNTPGKKQHKFVEFYDVRDAERAMKMLQENDIKGKKLKIEYSRPGGQIYRSNVSSQEQLPQTNDPPHHQFMSPLQFFDNTDYAFEDEANGTQQTTLMIRNIPNKFSQQTLLAYLDEHCKALNSQLQEDMPKYSYDFVYLPIDFTHKCNKGYAFVNFTSLEATQRVFNELNNTRWDEFKSRKVCQVTYAKYQGLPALEQHFKNSKFPSDMVAHLPIKFDPPRNGTNNAIAICVVNQANVVPEKHEKKSEVSNEGASEVPSEGANGVPSEGANEVPYGVPSEVPNGEPSKVPNGEPSEVPNEKTNEGA